MIKITKFLQKTNQFVSKLQSQKNIFTFAQYTNSSNLYKVLGVSSDSSIQEIKKAYYELAKEYHPDRSDHPNANEIFAKISQAYEVLSDQNKKKLYDSCGVDEEEINDSYQSNSQRFKNRAKYQQQRAKDKEDLFNDFDQFFQQKMNKSNNPPIKGNDIHETINLGFQESLQDKIRKTIQVEKTVKCKTCRGTRCAPNTFPSKCYTCGGSGTLQYRDKFDTVEEICDNCEGFGKIIRHKCSTCKGEGQVTRTVEEEIKIPEGVEDGQVLRKQGEGDVGQNGGKNGDLFVKINVLKDPYYTRQGNNIYTEYHLTPSQAILGGEVSVKTLKGDVAINLSKNVFDGKRNKLPNLGLQLKQSRFAGDHYVTFKIQVPKELSQDELDIYEKILSLEKKSQQQQQEFKQKQQQKYQQYNSQKQQNQQYQQQYQQEQY